jgi:DNA-directed RNA polymerase specialized sigma24 family protein
MGLLLHRHRPTLYATVLAILGHGQRAQDAVQDASLIALRRVHELREPAVFGGWLCAIGRNVSLMELRRSRRELLVADLPVGTEADAPTTRRWSAMPCAIGSGVRWMTCPRDNGWW